MALLLALKFSEEEMPKIYDPGGLDSPKVQDFVVVPREGTEDVGFVAALEYKSIHQLKLRPEPYPRVIRRATKEEVDSWWDRRVEERKAFVLGKEKARELALDIKMTRARIDPKENKIVFHFTSDQRIDFRALVKELSTLLKKRIELWQIGVRDEARMIDGFGVCGLQTCCSTWLKEFRPISIRMAKDQDINLPPTKLSGQCGRLLCCLSYEVDQYKKMGKEALPKGSTVQWEGSDWVIVDRNLIGQSYLLSDRQGMLKNVKAAELAGEAKVPEQMKRFGKQLAEQEKQLAKTENREAEERLEKDETRVVQHTESRSDVKKSGPEDREAKERGHKAVPMPIAPTEDGTTEPGREESSDDEKGRKGRPKKRRRRGRGGSKGDRTQRADSGGKQDSSSKSEASGGAAPDAPAKKPRRPRGDKKKKSASPKGEGGDDKPKKTGRTGRRGKKKKRGS